MGKLINLGSGSQVFSKGELWIDADIILGVEINSNTDIHNITGWYTRVFFLRPIDALIHDPDSDELIESKKDFITLYEGVDDNGAKRAAQHIKTLTRQINRARRHPLLRRILGV